MPAILDHARNCQRSARALIFCLLAAGIASNVCIAGAQQDDEELCLMQLSRPTVAARVKDVKKERLLFQITLGQLDHASSIWGFFACLAKELRNHNISQADFFVRGAVKDNRGREVDPRQAIDHALFPVTAVLKTDRDMEDIDLSLVDEHPMMHYNFGVDWRDWYDDMSQKFPSSKSGYDMINYGLATDTLHHCASDVRAAEPDQAPWAFNNTSGANMYATLASKSPTSLANARVLEISSGRGGGTALLADCFCPSQMLGLDISPKEIKSAQARYARNGSCPIKFLHGDAMKLPFKNESFDVVVNVEASHTYPSYRQFITEAHRILRPGGALLSADFRALKDAHTDALIIGNVFNKTVHPTDITSMVLRSFHENKLIKPFIQACTENFDKKGSTTANDTVVRCNFFAGTGFPLPRLSEGAWNYRMYVMQK